MGGGERAGIKFAETSPHPQRLPFDSVVNAWTIPTGGRSMNVEYTGRQYEITPAVRKQIEHGLSKIKKVLGDNFDTHVILSAEKHRHIAEITITIRNHPIVGSAEAPEMTAAVAESLDRIDRQAVKYKSRWRTRKRAASKKRWKSPASPASPQARVAAGASAAAAV